jgi:hypothetical protein
LISVRAYAKEGVTVKGARVLQAMAVVLLALGGIGVLFQLSGDAPGVMWLGAVGPILMGVALLIIARTLSKEE